MREYKLVDIAVGLTESFSRTITLQMENVFRELSGDNNPLHRDDEFAHSIDGNKFPGHVVFGMLTAAFYSTLAGMYLPGKYSLIHSLENLSFLHPVFAGDELTVTGKVVDKDDNLRLIRIKASIKNQQQKTVSKAVMKTMVLQ